MRFAPASREIERPSAGPHVPRTLVALPGIAITEIAYRPGETQPPHHHVVGSVTLVLAGGLEERVGPAHETGRPLSVVVKPAGIEHADRVGPDGALTIQIAVRSKLFGDGRTEAWRWLHGDRAARLFLGCLATARTEADDPAMIEAQVVDLIAALAEDERWDSKAPPRWLETVAQTVDDSFADGPRVEALAREAGVHPVYLARRFRRHYGTSVTERIRRRRLERAANLLSGSRTPLSVVAQESGFADQSHLSRVFRQATGLTPGGYRALAHG